LWLSVRLVIAAAAFLTLVGNMTPSSLVPTADLTTGRAVASTVDYAPTSHREPDRVTATSRPRHRTAPPTPHPSSKPSHRTSQPAPHRTRLSPAEQALRRMTLPQRVGQLFMVGTPATAASPRTLAQIGRFHVGNVMLTGRSYAGVSATSRVASRLQARATGPATARVPLLVSTDQEGGAVQVLNGPGFSQIPTALEQGRWTLRRLAGAAGTWARQLHAAGVNLDLAPVLDTVPGPAAAAQNPPIGVYDREFGYRPDVVARHGVTFARAMSSHGVAPTAKHFPGLGRVHANTDESSGVTDRVTRRHDPYLAPFARAVDAGVPAVMMSTAYYSRLDRHHPAAFSSFIIRTMLRGDLGFRKVVVSDDLGTAQQVARWSYGARAVQFLRAGGDLVLTVDPATLPAMYGAVLQRARTNDHFRALVTRSATRVLDLKAERHLIGS
jgi:beta-N-acetylhexosaminidase